MKNNIDFILGYIESTEDYILNNEDYTENYDILLADDCVYHNTQWDNAIKAIVPDISADALEYIKQQIINSPWIYCDITVKNPGFPINPPEYTVASFPIGEHETQIRFNASTFTPAMVDYLNKTTDYYFTYRQGEDYILGYINLEYATVDYTLKPDDIKEAYNTWLEDQQEEEN